MHANIGVFGKLGIASTTLIGGMITIPGMVTAEWIKMGLLGAAGASGLIAGITTFAAGIISFVAQELARRGVISYKAAFIVTIAVSIIALATCIATAFIFGMPMVFFIPIVVLTLLMCIGHVTEAARNMVKHEFSTPSHPLPIQTANANPSGSVLTYDASYPSAGNEP
jgi:hypothetical protein